MNLAQKRFWENEWEKYPERARSTHSIYFFKINGGKTLDVGCGDLGYSSLPEFSDYFVGVDISETAAKKAKERYEKSDFIVASAAHLPFRDDSFDDIISSETLTLLGKYFEKSLEEMGRVAKDRISFIISHREIALAISKNSHEYLQHGILFHEPNFDAVAVNEEDISDLLKKMNLKVEEMETLTEDELDNLGRPTYYEPIHSEHGELKSRIYVKASKNL